MQEKLEKFQELYKERVKEEETEKKQTGDVLKYTKNNILLISLDNMMVLDKCENYLSN